MSLTFVVEANDAVRCNDIQADLVYCTFSGVRDKRRVEFDAAVDQLDRLREPVVRSLGLKAELNPGLDALEVGDRLIVDLDVGNFFDLAVIEGEPAEQVLCVAEVLGVEVNEVTADPVLAISDGNRHTFVIGVFGTVDTVGRRGVSATAIVKVQPGRRK